MKKVTVNAQQLALIFKRGAYQKMLREGAYWLWRKNAVVYNISQPFQPPVELNLLLRDTELANALEVIEVADHEIALQFQNGLFQQVLTAGRYAFWKSAIRYDFVKADLTKIKITENIHRDLLEHKLVASYVRTYKVESYEKALLFVDGKSQGELKPGTHYWWKNAITIHVAKADTRQQQLEINGQEILTKDKANLRINAWAQYRVVDAATALLDNAGYDRQLYVAIQQSLREYVAGFAFDELLEKRESIAPLVLQQAATAAAALGVQVTGLGIRDIILPGDIREIMNQVLVAEKKAQANTIMRREETASTRSLLNTAKMMEENAMLWKLKEMEYVEKIADKISNISVSGNGVLIDQLKQLFVPGK
ncbi:slipin family protein [Niabella drilacis]|uniref:SPFH domain / Band 7 family protein n=1 Tax=Niabella drilacis (strain DSM 25811 / CCM 8410 / CCUG 62505 / LMG 26954 / E90) TaxID=1285928 RepID=A0A1G6JRL9_NIADE|nr:slipin family protein [Niabella drilacis]SDC21392.1 SPFH domain / Band 7 family protein [Niabella drilacis]